MGRNDLSEGETLSVEWDAQASPAYGSTQKVQGGPRLVYGNAGNLGILIMQQENDHWPKALHATGRCREVAEKREGTGG